MTAAKAAETWIRRFIRCGRHDARMREEVRCAARGRQIRKGETEIYSRTISGTLSGLNAETVTVEANVTFGFPVFHIVGLADTAIKESKERVRAAIINAGANFPQERVIVNLSPADIRKEGTHFDLPLAVSILTAAGRNCGKIPGEGEKCAYFGELALDGSVVPVKGILPLLIDLSASGIQTFFIPAGNLKEASIVPGIRLLPVSALRELLDHFAGTRMIRPVETGRCRKADIAGTGGTYGTDYADVEGQEEAKRALQISAAGLHNVLLVGPPGSGKSMLIRRLPGILPPMTWEETVEVTKIYSICGMLDAENPLMTERPFRAPDMRITPASLVGGGMRPKPGEISLAHLGVLFLDELPEYSRQCLEALRVPMEEEAAVVVRTGGKVIFPAKFLTAAAMNPCPCGYLGDDRRECTCTQYEIARYRARLSGPFLDRIDLFVPVRRPDRISFFEDDGNRTGMSTAQLREGVIRARSAQERRFDREPISYNSQMTPGQLKKFCRLSEASEKLLAEAVRSLALSVRSGHRILRTARTIADLEGKDRIEERHIAEAIRYKKEDGKR